MNSLVLRIVWVIFFYNERLVSYFNICQSYTYKPVIGSRLKIRYGTSLNQIKQTYASRLLFPILVDRWFTIRGVIGNIQQAKTLKILGNNPFIICKESLISAHALRGIRVQTQYQGHSTPPCIEERYLRKDSYLSQPTSNYFIFSIFIVTVINL